MSNNIFQKRRLILICGIAVLAVIYAFQLAFTGKSQVKTYTVDSDINAVELSSASGTILLESKDGAWFMGHYKADASAVQELVNSLKEIKVLGTVASNDSDADRYGLSDSSRIFVKAMSGDKVVREIKVGKNTGTNSQSYIQMDGKKQVCLVQGALNSVFSKNADSLRDKVVLSVDTASVMSIKSESHLGTFGVVKNAPAMTENPENVWSVAENSTDTTGNLSDDKVNSWVNAFASVKASEWLEDDAAFDYENTVTLTVATSSSNIVIKVAVVDEENAFVKTTQSDYVAKIPVATADKLTKKFVELIK